MACRPGFDTPPRLLVGLIAAAILGLLPTPGRADDPELKIRIVWRAEIGSSSGSPVVHRGKVLVGTNNSAPRAPAVRDDRGVMMCFDQRAGTFLGQVTHARLAHRSNDLPGLGIICRPCVEENRAYYVSNRGELACLDLDGFVAANARPPVNKVRWTLDMVTASGVFKRDAGDVGNPLSSPLIIGDLVYCVTGNGSNFGYERSSFFGRDRSPFVPKPEAPSFLAVNKKTGKVAWSSATPGKDIQYGQWGSPALARVAGVDQVLFPGGDGWLYGFEAETGKQVWKVDCNRASATRWGPGKPGTRVAFMAAPVVKGDVAYVGTAVDREIVDPERPIYAVEVTHKGDATRRAIRWTFADKTFGGTFGSVALGKDTLYALGDSGVLVCLDPATGKELWRTKLDRPHQISSPVAFRGKVLVAAGESLVVFQDARKRILLGEYDLEGGIMGTPFVLDNQVFVVAGKYLLRLEIADPARAQLDASPARRVAGFRGPDLSPNLLDAPG
jgi:outer membrane protein assembly factor BamB